MITWRLEVKEEEETIRILIDGIKVHMTRRGLQEEGNWNRNELSMNIYNNRKHYMKIIFGSLNLHMKLVNV